MCQILSFILKKLTKLRKKMIVLNELLFFASIEWKGTFTPMSTLAILTKAQFTRGPKS